MKTLLRPLLAALCLFALCALSTNALAQIRPKAYAPENLRSLSLPDQERVIGLEYEEQSGGQRIPDDQLRFYLDQVNRSNWGFSRIKSDIAQSLGAGGTGPNPGGSIRCESSDNRRRTCTTPWRGRSRLVNQLSGSSCIENRSWTSGYGEVTVWNGCRAQFAEAWNDDDGGAYPGTGQAIRCESTDGRSRSCRTPWDGPSAVHRQLSDTRCIEGRNWNSRDGEVTVWGGCRAEFTSRWDDDSEPGYDRTVRCESTNSRARTCDVPWRGASQVVRQLSDTPCTQGYSWESSNGRVTVMRGCRAEFGPGGSNWPGHERVVTCSSDNGRYTTCHWPPGQGRPRLRQQLSREACVEGRSWGMQSHNTIWVSRGCRAVFGD